MMTGRKLFLLAAVAAFAGFGINSVNATDIDVTATMTASGAVSVANNANIDFGGVDFVAVHSGVVELGTNGAAVLSGDTGLTLTGSPTSGELAVSSTSGTILISCDATAVIGDGTRDLNITGVKWDTVNTATYAAATNTCAGLGASAVSIDTAVTNNPTVFVGAELTIGSNALVGSSGGTAYDTSTGGGDPITFRLVFN